MLKDKIGLCIGKKSSNKNYETRGNPLMNDLVYVSKIRLSCPFCSNKNHGTNKIIKSLWALQCHFTTVHHNDVYCKKIITNLEDLLRQEVIRL